MTGPVLQVSDPLRILIVIKSLGPGGAERLVLNQLRLADHQHFSYELFIAKEREPNLLDEARSLGLPVHLGYECRGAALLALRRLLKRGNFDVVHSHLPIAAVTTRMAAASLRHRPALVYTEHNRWGSYRPTTRLLNRFTIGLDDTVVAVSADTATSVRPLFDTRVVTIEHGVDIAHGADDKPVEALREELGVRDDQFLFGTVANLRSEKNQAGLLDAFACAEFAPDVSVVIVGQGPLEDDLIALAQKLGVQAQVHFLGYREDAVSIMKNFDVFILPSTHEGRPVALMEAMSQGIPVLVSSAGGMSDMVEHERSGLVVPPSDADTLAAAMVRMRSDSGLRARLVSGATEAAKAYSASSAYDAIENIYLDVTS